MGVDFRYAPNRLIQKVGDDVALATGQTSTVDQVSLTEFRGVKYYINLFNTTEGVFRSCEVSVLELGGGGIVDTLSSRLGDSFAFEINVQVVSGNIELVLVNNEVYPVSYSVYKTPL